MSKGSCLNEAVPNSHKVEVVRVVIEPHPNADKLEIANIFGFTCCVQKGQFQNDELAAYVQPDSIVDTSRPEFEFLKGNKRIRVKKLRGVVSMGLLLKAPEGAVEGDDVAEYFGVTHYEPAPSGGSNEHVRDDIPPPNIYAPKYDVDNMLRYSRMFNPGETVVATEKIHGTNARYVYHPIEQKMYVGSKNQWVEQGDNWWWKALAQNPQIEAFCIAFPGAVLYGEVFGNVQTLRYGAVNGEYKFVAFDLMIGQQWTDFDEMRRMFEPYGLLPPIVFEGAFDYDLLISLADGNTLVGGANPINQIREGIVVKPVRERYVPRLGRVHLKIVSNDYLETN